MAILSKVQRGQPITADLINNIIDGIQECRLQSVVGGYFRRGQGGTTVTRQPSRQQEGTLCPFHPTAKVATSGREVSFQAGTINGVLPTNMFEKLSGVTTASNTYYYLKCTTDGKVITEAVIEKDTVLRAPVQPEPDTAPTEFNIMIGYTTTAGITDRTISCGHLQARIAPSLQEDADEYVAGQRNYTQYYNWVF